MCIRDRKNAHIESWFKRFGEFWSDIIKTHQIFWISSLYVHSLVEFSSFMLSMGPIKWVEQYIVLTLYLPWVPNGTANGEPLGSQRVKSKQWLTYLIKLSTSDNPILAFSLVYWISVTSHYTWPYVDWPYMEMSATNAAEHNIFPQEAKFNGWKRHI